MLHEVLLSGVWGGMGGKRARIKLTDTTGTSYPLPRRPPP